MRIAVQISINETAEELKELYVDVQNCKLEYDDNHLCGKIAKEHGKPVGEIGCPHCGISAHGAIGRICGWCDADIFSSDSRSLYEILYEAAEKRRPEIRKGQEIYNFAYTLFPKEVDMLNATDADCFYADSKINDFIENLIFLINHPTTK